MIILVLISYAIWAIYELFPLYKQKLWKDFWVDTAFGLLSIVVATLLCFHVKIPSPAMPISDFITSFVGK